MGRPSAGRSGTNVTETISATIHDGQAECTHRVHARCVELERLTGANPHPHTRSGPSLRSICNSRPGPTPLPTAAPTRGGRLSGTRRFGLGRAPSVRSAPGIEARACPVRLAEQTPARQSALNHPSPHEADRDKRLDAEPLLTPGRPHARDRSHSRAQYHPRAETPFAEGATISTPQLNCSKCGGTLEQGFVIDSTYGANLVSRWAPGAPQRSFWVGTKKPEHMLVPIGAFRCSSCGFLEHYARPDLGAK